MYEEHYQFELTGIRPLIMHWDNLEWADQINAERGRIKSEDKSAFNAGDDRCPPHTWKGYTYNDGHQIALPTDNLRAMLVKAGVKVTLKNKETFKKLMASGILFDEIFCTFLLNGKPILWDAVQGITGTFAEQCAAVKKLGFTLLTKRAKVGQTKHIRVRARFDSWRATGSLLVVDAQITPEILQKIFTIGGLDIGLCDWRPGSPLSPGPFGCFDGVIRAV